MLNLLFLQNLFFCFLNVEISYVADGAEESKITNAVGSVLHKLGLPPQLMHIRAAEFAVSFCGHLLMVNSFSFTDAMYIHLQRRYSTDLKLDSQVVKAAEEAAERCSDHVNRYGQFWNLKCILSDADLRIVFLLIAAAGHRQQLQLQSSISLRNFIMRRTWSKVAIQFFFSI